MYEQITLNIPANANVKIALKDVAQPEGCNVSNIDGIAQSSTRTGYAGFHVSRTPAYPVTPLNGQYKLYNDSEGYPGFISSQLASALGTVNPEVQLSFLITNGTADYLTITFDDVLGECAQTFDVIFSNGGNQKVLSITDNNLSFILLPLKHLGLSNLSSQTVTLSITKWNKPNKNIKITQFTPELTLRYNGKDIYSFTCSENSMDSSLSLTPGIVEQYADLQLYDRQGALKQLIGEGELDDVARCKVTINAVGQDTTYFLGSYRVKSWEAQTATSQVDITCDDVFESFKNIDVAVLPLESRTLHKMFGIAFDYVKTTAWKYADSDVENMCKSITMPNSWTKASNLYDFINKICAIGFLRIYHFEGQFIIMRLVKDAQ